MSMNATSSGSGRVDDIHSHPHGEFRGRTKPVNIAEDVRKYAAEQGLTESEALESGMQEKRKKFVERAAELYAET
jgi:hypothetical protein